MKQCHHCFPALWKALLLAIIIAPMSLLAQKKIPTNPVSKTSAPSLDHVFRNYSLISVDAPALVAHARLNPRRSMDVELELTGLPPMRLLLEENDILSSDYQLVTGSSAGRQVYEKPTSTGASDKLFHR